MRNNKGDRCFRWRGIVFYHEHRGRMAISTFSITRPVNAQRERRLHDTDGWLLDSLCLPLNLNRLVCHGLQILSFSTLRQTLLIRVRMYYEAGAWRSAFIATRFQGWTRTSGAIGGITNKVPSLFTVTERVVWWTTK